VRAFLVACTLAVVLPGNTLAVQSQPPDFSGRWMLAAPSSAASSGPDTLDVVAPDELLVAQTPHAITVQHSSKPGTHPAAGTFEFGTGGRVGGIPGRALGILAAESESRWSVSFVGSQFIISDSTTVRKGDARPVTGVTAATWMINGEGRLVINFREQRTGQSSKSATLVYVRSAR
jgi:hypothetical protein